MAFLDYVNFDASRHFDFPPKLKLSQTRRECRYCLNAYTPKSPNQTYCDAYCRTEGAKLVAEFKKARIAGRVYTCDHCQSVFTPSIVTQRFCSEGCTQGYRESKAKVIEERKTKPKSCYYCSKDFIPSVPGSWYCDPACKLAMIQQKARERAAKTGMKEKVPQLAKIAGKRTSYENFSNLFFMSEDEFVQWFRLNYSLFGIRRLIKLDRWFPDCRAEMFDGRHIDIELEYHARNFVTHRHDADNCDLIISFITSERLKRIGNIPIVSIFTVKDFVANGDFDPESKKLTQFFQGIVDYGHKTIERILANQNQE